MKGIAEALGVSRSNLYERGQRGASSSRGNYRKAEDGVLVPLIREIVDERPT
jgi:putative transposase